MSHPRDSDTPLPVSISTEISQINDTPLYVLLFPFPIPGILTQISFPFFVTKEYLCKGEGSQASTDAIVHLLVRSQKKRRNVNFTRACKVSSVLCKETQHKFSLSTVHYKTVCPNSSKKIDLFMFPILLSWQINNLLLFIVICSLCSLMEAYETTPNTGSLT